MIRVREVESICDGQTSPPFSVSSSPVTHTIDQSDILRIMHSKEDTTSYGIGGSFNRSVQRLGTSSGSGQPIGKSGDPVQQGAKENLQGAGLGLTRERNASRLAEGTAAGHLAGRLAGHLAGSPSQPDDRERKISSTKSNELNKATNHPTPYAAWDVLKNFSDGGKSILDMVFCDAAREAPSQRRARGEIVHKRSNESMSTSPKDDIVSTSSLTPRSRQLKINSRRQDPNQERRWTSTAQKVKAGSSREDAMLAQAKVEVALKQERLAVKDLQVELDRTKEELKKETKEKQDLLAEMLILRERQQSKPLK